MKGSVYVHVPVHVDVNTHVYVYTLIVLWDGGGLWVQRALRVNPHFSQSLNNLGVVYTVQVWGGEGWGLGSSFVKWLVGDLGF